MIGPERERRKHRRLPIKLTVLYQKIDSKSGALRRGDTLNISTGGLLMEAHQGGLSTEVGSLIKVDLQIRPTDGLFEMAGRISGITRVTRIFDKLPDSQVPAQTGRKMVALQFCQRPVFDV